MTKALHINAKLAESVTSHNKLKTWSKVISFVMTGHVSVTNSIELCTTHTHAHTHTHTKNKNLKTSLMPATHYKTQGIDSAATVVPSNMYGFMTQ